MIKINILKKGDEVISITERFVAIKKKNGRVEIYNVYFNDKNELYADPIAATIIDYGEGNLEKKLDDGETTIINF